MSRQAIDQGLPGVSDATMPRRGWLFGVGAAGAAVLAVKALPAAAPLAQVAAAAKSTVDPHGGYQVTPHVLRYYETARG